MKYLPVLAATLLLISCANSPQHRYARLAVGMTKQQVLDLLGAPRSVVPNGALTTWEYDFSREEPEAFHPEQPKRSSYYVIIGRDDRVRSFNYN